MNVVYLQVLDDVVEGAGGAAAKLATISKLGTALKVTGITLSALGVVLDVVAIAIAANDLSKGSKAELADKLRDIATNMEKEIDAMKKDDNCETEKEGDATEQFLNMESTT